MAARPRFLALQHIACEPPGAFEDELLDWGATLHRIEVDAGDPLPRDHHDLTGIIVMGGPMGAYEDAMTGLARRLFAAWLGQVVRLTPASLPA